MPAWNEFSKQVAFACGVEIEKLAQPPAAADGADLSCSICFELARERKQPPFKIAEEFIGTIELSKYPLIEKIENKGGYLNFFAKREDFFRKAVSEALEAKGAFGSSQSLSGNVLVEFPSVNPNKPWHIGHARNAVLGDTLSRILSAAGYAVTKMDYIDDLGLQVAKVYWGLKNLPGERHPKFDQHLGLLYVDVEAEATKDAGVEEKVRTIMHEMEKGIGPTAPEVRAMVERCVKAQYQTAYRLGVFHDLLIFESDIVASGMFGTALSKMRETGVVSKAAEGEKKDCLVCDVSDFPGFENLTDKEVVLVRSDGTATYTAKDVAFQMWKFGLFESPFKFAGFEGQPNGVTARMSSQSGESYQPPKSNMVINVIGAEQSHPQRIVYSILRRMGFPSEEARSFHLSYEHVWLPEGRFSGRKGTWVGFSMDEVIEEAVERARAEVDSRSTELPEDEKRKIAEAVGTGAIRYTLIKYAPEKKITFKWEEALSFDGNAAPYLQYALARCMRIIEKSGRGTPVSISDTAGLENAEFALAKKVSLLPTEVAKIAGGLRKEVWGTRTDISRLAEYAYELATELSSFYTVCRVIGSDREERRLALVEATRLALSSALTLLGIPLVERM
jgi:arginyl-tRNA synthetase